MKIFSFLCVLIFFSCQERKLPILGLRHIENGDTIYVKTPDFSCQNQFNELIERKHLEGKIHISNFFFTSCATICPKTIRSMIKIGNHFKSNNEIHYINFSIDYRKDSVGRLKTYFDKLQIDVPNFQLLHISTMEEVKRISENYMSIAVEDPSAQGGFCLLYTSDAADERSSVDLGGRRIIKKTNTKKKKKNDKKKKIRIYNNNKQKAS